MKRNLALLRKFEGSKLRLAVLCTCLSLAHVSPSFSQSQTSKDTEKPSHTRIEVDEKNDVIRFYIKGAPAAMLDENGFHVIASMYYGGTIKDNGFENVKSDINETEKK